MQFHIRAITNDDAFVEMTLEAMDERDARQQVIARGWFVSDIRSLVDQKKLKATRAQVFSRAKFSLLLFSQELHALLVAGLSVVEALEALLEKESNAFIVAVLEHLLIGLKEGKRLSDVVAERSDVFPILYVGIIQASERTSDLPQSLQRYIIYQERINLIRNKIVSALIYPAILFCVGIGVTFFLIAYVVPRFAEVYRGTGRQLPWMSQRLLDWGHFSSEHSTILIAVLIASLIGASCALNRMWKNGGMLALLNKLPGVSEYLRIYILSRLYLTLGMLLDGGIPVVQALQTVAVTVPLQVRSSLIAAQSSIESGSLFSDAFLDKKLTTPISYRMLRVGERSGELGQMLTQSANFYEGEIGRWIDRFIRSFEPMLMAIIGVVVGAIVIMLYMPIFDLADGLG